GQQFVEFLTAFLGVEDFVGEIAAEDKRFAPGFLNREAEAGIVDVEADVHSPFANLPPQRGKGNQRGRKPKGHPLAARSSRHRPSRGEEFLFLLPLYQLVSV